MSEPTFADLGEDRIVARILARIPAADHVLIGPGDDAAVSVSPGRLVSTVDMLVEGEDFLQGWLDPARLGVKAAAQNLADVRAMGARPTGLLLSLAAPGHTPASFVDGLLDGMVSEAARAGASVLGGDLSDAPQIVIAVTALGSLAVDQPPLTRDAACPGFDVLLGGQTGWAAAGLEVLLASGGALPVEDPASAADVSARRARAVEAQRAPRPDYTCVDSLREAVDLRDEADGPQAALIDLSDGLSSDAGRMARASAVTIDLDAGTLDALADDLVPLAAHVLGLKDDASTVGPAGAAHPADRAGSIEDSVDADRARALARRWILTGGEDHGFLAAVPTGVHPLGWTRIGRVRPVATDAGTAGAPHVLIDGVPVDDAGFAAVDPDGGFRHFSGAGE
ncbi:thiamine-phosphate kinase [Brevibacterium yomogidense]